MQNNRIILFVTAEGRVATARRHREYRDSTVVLSVSSVVNRHYSYVRPQLYRRFTNGPNYVIISISDGAVREGTGSAVSHHGSESDSTLVVEAALQAVAPRHVKLATHIGAKPNFNALPAVA